jgi:hypothetical protein
VAVFYVQHPSAPAIIIQKNLVFLTEIARMRAGNFCMLLWLAFDKVLPDFSFTLV